MGGLALGGRADLTHWAAAHGPLTANAESLIRAGGMRRAAPGAVHPLIVVVCLIIILAAMKIAAAVIVPFLLAILLAVAFHPVADWLGRRGLPVAASAMLTTIGVLGVITGAAALLYRAGSELVASLPRYQAQLLDAKVRLTAWLGAHGMSGAATSVAKSDPMSAALDAAGPGLAMAGDFVQTIFLVLLITAFVQLESATYRTKLVKVFGTARSLRTSLAALHEVQRYLLVKVVLSAVGSTMLGLWCWAWGVDSPLLWGVLAFVLNFIPVVGSIISAVPPVLFTLIDDGAGTALGVAAGYLFVNIVIDNMLEPRIMGRTLGLSPLAVLLAMLVWGFVLGPVGAILSVPLTMTVKIILERNPELRRVAALLGDATDEPPPQGAMPGAPTLPMPPPPEAREPAPK